ncbi:MAG: response regulator transcription factor [Chthoniobacteraceae bacterium]
MKKRIVIVDDHVSIRDMLSWILMKEACYEVIGEAGSGLEAMRICGLRRPDLLILDLALPCISGVEVLRRVRKEMPSIRVLIYSGTCNCALIKSALWERPHGYVDKLEGLGILRQAISTVTNGGSYFGVEARQLLAETMGGTPRENELTSREREVLQLVAEGRSSKEISSLLDLATKTVENHRANLMVKLNLHDVASLTRYAAGRGLVAIE